MAGYHPSGHSFISEQERPIGRACEGGFNGATDFHNLLMVVAMPAGRYLPMVCVLALAGRLAKQQPGVVTVGTLRAHGVGLVVLATAASVILAWLNFQSALSLGAVADGLL